MQLDTRCAVSSWSLSGWLASTTLATIAFWSIFGACVDASSASDASDASAGSSVHAIVAWDPRACGEPHRVIVELEDRQAVGPPAGGEPIAASVPCTIGEVTLDAPHAGVYVGRAYAWSPNAPPGPARWASQPRLQSAPSSVVPLVLVLDALVTRWEVPTPR